MKVRLVRRPIDVAEMRARALSAKDGAVSVFEGAVRAEGDPDPIVALEYSAYEEMAIREMEKIREETLGRFAVSEVLLAHRLGRLEVGEVSVAVVVAAPHRDAAFAACRFAIDELKAKTPIWKKEIRLGGSGAWVEPAEGA